MLAWSLYYWGWFGKYSSREYRCLTGPPLIIFHTTSGKIIFFVRLQFIFLYKGPPRCVSVCAGHRVVRDIFWCESCMWVAMQKWLWAGPEGKFTLCPPRLPVWAPLRCRWGKTRCCFEKWGAMPRGHAVPCRHYLPWGWALVLLVSVNLPWTSALTATKIRNK